MIKYENGQNNTIRSITTNITGYSKELAIEELTTHRPDNVSLVHINDLFSTEAEDNPFEDLFNDSSEQTNELVGDSGNEEEANEANPFDTNTDDPFAGGGETDNKEQPKPLVLNREEAIKEKYNMNSIIRLRFPTYTLQLRDIIRDNIQILERSTIDHKFENDRSELVKRYKDVETNVREYLSIIDSEKHEDIFTNYVKFWAVLNKLKDLSNKILRPEEK